MATNMYIKFETPAITGSSTDTNHPDEIEVLSWSHGFSQPTSPTRVSAGSGTTERANHSDFSFTKYMDVATDDLLKQCWTGKQIGTATLSCYRSDGESNPVMYLEIKMEKVVVSNFSVSGGGGDIPIENVSLNYGKITYTYKVQKKADGTGGGDQPVSHDLETNVVS